MRRAISISGRIRPSLRLRKRGKEQRFIRIFRIFRSRGTSASSCGCRSIPLTWPMVLRNMSEGPTDGMKSLRPMSLFHRTPIASSADIRCPDIEAAPERYDLISFDVMPGDVIIHHVRTVHGAGGNPSDRWRRAMSFRYCGDKVRYFDRPGAISQVGVAHDLKNGDRLFSADYPVVWPRPWPGFRMADAFDAQIRLQKGAQASTA